jgi:hypothetical protein
MKAVDEVWRELILKLRGQPELPVAVPWTYLTLKGVDIDEFHALATPDLQCDKHPAGRFTLVEVKRKEKR